MSSRLVRDLRKLGWHLTGLFVLLVVSATLVWWSLDEEHAASQAHSRAATLFQDAKARLLKVGIEEQEIKDKSARLQKLALTGVVGNEQRLDWIELLHRLRNELRLMDLTYEFAPQTPLDTAMGNGYAFYSSSLKVHLRLWHEGDLVRFLARLQEEARALVLVRACKLARPSPNENSLTADCEFAWITARTEGRTP